MRAAGSHPGRREVRRRPRPSDRGRTRQGISVSDPPIEANQWQGRPLTPGILEMGGPGVGVGDLLNGAALPGGSLAQLAALKKAEGDPGRPWPDRKSTRLNSSHLGISYA